MSQLPWENSTGTGGKLSPVAGADAGSKGQAGKLKGALEVAATDFDSGERIGGVFIGLSGPTSKPRTTSKAKSTVLFSGLDPGAYTLKGECSDYQACTVSVTVTGGSTAQAELPMKRTSTFFEVLVQDESGKNMKGVECQIKTSDGRPYNVVTKEDGTARIEGIPPGCCQVSFPKISASRWD
jgi:hypothetical protein